MEDDPSKVKIVVCTQNCGESPDERDWAKQWAGLDPPLMAQFPTVVDWQARAREVIWITRPTWDNIVDKIFRAAVSAQRDGVVVIATGHGHGNKDHPEEGLINFDPAEHQGNLSWQPGNEQLGKTGTGVFFDQVITTYLDPITDPHNPVIITTLKQLDEKAIKDKTAGWRVRKMRHDAFDAVQQMGSALHANLVRRLTFTSCSAGKSTVFMDGLAKLCQTEVATFKVKTAVFNDANFVNGPGKARMTLESDASSPGGTNIPLARVTSPNLDDPSIAYVGGKRP